MNWIEAKITTTSEGIDEISTLLISAGIGGFSVQDAGEFEEFLADTRVHWDYIDEEVLKLRECITTLTFYLPETPEGMESLGLVKDSLLQLRKKDESGSLGTLELTFRTVREEDWAENWKQYFKPIPVGSKLLIKPSWETVKDTEGRLILEIDPKMSFGTGTHQTTKLCLEELESVIRPGDKVLDMGCGSGILSVAALLLGAGSAWGIDVDPLAVKTAEENASVNGVSDRFRASCGDVLSDPKLRELLGGGYDVIAANIVSDVIIAMSPLFTSLLRKGGVLVTSGIIEERCTEVQNALLGNGFTVISIKTDGGWCAVTAARQ